jgi:hypothetical protein
MHVCMHGRAPHQCALCHPAERGCDYGDCKALAVSLVGYTREWRPMCAKHAARVMGWDARLRLRVMEAAKH